jgi:hypothetical protein
LGVVSLASDVEETNADRSLELLAADPATSREILEELYEDLNVVFWTITSRAKELLPLDRELAQSALDGWTGNTP